MPTTAIFNCDLFTPDENIPQGLVLVEGRQIRAVGRSHEIPLPVNTRLIDAQGCRVTPGLIDLGGAPATTSEMAARGITSCINDVTKVQWGLPKESGPEPDRHYLATLEHVRSADPSVLRALLASHHLILTGSAAKPLSTRTIRQLMALADTDFAAALSAATLAPSRLLDLPFGRLTAGAPANLICWTRYGNLAWTMLNGGIVYPKR